MSSDLYCRAERTAGRDAPGFASGVACPAVTLRETAELIEHGITVGGKPLRDHLEAVDHYNAVLWMRECAAKTNLVDEDIVRELHRRIVARSQPDIGGIYSALPRRIVGSSVVFPNPAKIPQ